MASTTRFLALTKPGADTDGYQEDDDGSAGDASARADCPEDVALDSELLKRGIPDEDGREDRSAMKTQFMTKRDFDRNVGGGVDRDKLSASDFVFPDTRSFPIVKAGDVSDAVSSWGRYKGPHSFEEFQSRLRAIAKRKGFEGSLPDSWKTGKSYAPEPVGTKAWVNLEGSFEDTKADLQEAIDRMVDTVFPEMDVTSFVAATYPDKAIVALVHNGEKSDIGLEYIEVPYTIEADDVVTLSEPKSLDVAGVAVDRESSDLLTFLSPAAVAAKGLQLKNVTRLMRRYSLMVDRSPAIAAQVYGGHPGLTPELLRNAPEGLSYIPGEGDPDYRTGQMDLTQPGGAEPNIPDNSATTATGVTASPGNMNAPALPAWYQGAYYVDNAGNLSAVPVTINTGPFPNSDNVGMTPGAVDSSLYTGHHYGDQPPVPLPNIQGVSRDAGTLTLAGMNPGETKNETRIQRHRRLLDLMKVRLPDADEPLSDSTDDELKSIIGLVSEAFTEVKEGRVLSGANTQAVQDAHEATGHMLAGHAKLAEAHDKLGQLLQAAGVQPSVFSPTSDTPGEDEEGVPIEPVEAKDLMGDIAEWYSMQGQDGDAA